MVTCTKQLKTRRLSQTDVSGDRLVLLFFFRNMDAILEELKNNDDVDVLRAVAWYKEQLMQAVEKRMAECRGEIVEPKPAVSKPDLEKILRLCLIAGGVLANVAVLVMSQLSEAGEMQTIEVALELATIVALSLLSWSIATGPDTQKRKKL